MLRSTQKEAFPGQIHAKTQLNEGTFFLNQTGVKGGMRLAFEYPK
jgi:hypothetical protein